jgi:GTP-binding protein HflX
VIVVDASDDECLEQIAVVESILEYFEVQNKPRLFAFNKSDMCTNERIFDLKLLYGTQGRVVNISAKNNDGTEELITQLESLCRYGKRKHSFLFPYTDQGALSSFFNVAEIIETEYTDNGTQILAWVDEKAEGQYKKYIVE